MTVKFISGKTLSMLKNDCFIHLQVPVINWATHVHIILKIHPYIHSADLHIKEESTFILDRGQCCLSALVVLYNFDAKFLLIVFEALGVVQSLFDFFTLG